VREKKERGREEKILCTLSRLLALWISSSQRWVVTWKEMGGKKRGHSFIPCDGTVHLGETKRGKKQKRREGDGVTNSLVFSSRWWRFSPRFQ